MVPIFIDISRIHIVVLSATAVLTFGWLFTGNYPWFLACVCALDWYIVNLLNKTVDLQEDKANQITGTEFISRHKKRLTQTIAIILILSLLFVHWLNPAITVLRLTGHLLGLFYNWPLLPGSKRLKSIYFWKNTASALGFLITVIGYPLATAVWSTQGHVFPIGITWPTVFCSGLFLFIFVLSYEIIYDMRDIEGDRMMGYRTYPVVHGEKGTAFLIDSLIMASIAILTIGYLNHVVPWRIFIMAGAPILQFMTYKRALHNGGITARFCIGMTWSGAGMFVIYQLWAMAGLPGAGL